VRQVAGWLRKHAVPLGLLVLVGAGCGGESNDETSDATTTSSSLTMARPAAFVAEARAMTFGTKDLAAASDGELLRLGQVVCDGLAIEGVGYGRVVQRLVQSDARPTTVEARALVKSAVRTLCPARASTVPS
jgi:hypothetical protein